MFFESLAKFKALRAVGTNGRGGRAMSEQTGEYVPQPGTANQGNGGGGAGRNGGQGANGGSGVVIIRYPETVVKATGGTITYITGYVVHTFTSSGNFVVN